MKNESSLEMANTIAELIINKSFWGNEWFAFFSLLLVGLVSALCAWGGTYISTRSQNAAIRADFEKTLKNIEKQTDAVKNIEENIAHDFIEKRELLKIKRNKIEELYLALATDYEQMSHNLSVATSDINQNIIMPSNNVQMLAQLYFKDELQKEIDFFREQRSSFATRTRELAGENLNGIVVDGQERVKQNLVYIRNYNQAKVNMELALETVMKNLTSS